MKLAIGTLTVLLSMAAVASAEQAKPFLCWPLSRVTGSSAIYDRPGGIEIGRLDPSATYNMGQEAREIDGEMWREIGRAEVSMGWVKRTSVTQPSAGVSCIIFKEFFRDRIVDPAHP